LKKKKSIWDKRKTTSHELKGGLKKVGGEQSGLPHGNSSSGDGK